LYNYHSKPLCFDYITVEISNTGEKAGDEVAQLYIRDEVSSVTRPVKELKGYQRISLQPGQTRTVQFTLDAGALAFYDANMDYVVEPGTFQIMTGASSRDQDLQKQTLTVSQKISVKE
jgi:beta-glucosidase